MQLKNSAIRTWAADQPSPYQLRDITHFPDWGWLIILDAFFNNLTSGLMLAIALVWAFGPPFMVTLLPIALTTALILLIIDLGILVKDLGDPLRFIHSLRVMRLTSPLSVGVWGLSCYGIFLGIATVTGWLLLAAGASGTLIAYFLVCIQRVCLVMAIIAAIVVICYKGVVFSCSSQPGLREARWLTPFMVSDSLLMGMSLYAIISNAFLPQSGAAVLLVMPLAILLLARCAAFALLWQDVKARAAAVDRDGTKQAVFISVYLVGGLLPLIMIFIGPFWISAAALLILGIGLVERAWLLRLPRPAAHNA